MRVLLDRISIDRAVCFGRPPIRGTRLWVSLILDCLTDGMSLDEVLMEYPQLSVEGVRAAIVYGAEVTRERFADLPEEAVS